MIATAAARTAAARAVPRRLKSTAAQPKMHRAKDVWAELEKTRPKDDHPHLVFHPPFDKIGVGLGVTAVVCAGYGAMYFGMRHQQYKQGYWK